MSEDVTIAAVAAGGIIMAGAVPAWLTYLTARRNKVTVEQIRDQVLPNNGTRLWQYAQEARDCAADANANAREALFTIKRHEFNYQHQRRDLDAEWEERA